jgi:cytochrome b pre-mRNA-processing protein 3
MLGFLFRTLTAAPAEGAALFDRLTAEARRPEWFLAGGVADTLDGRFAVLSTLTAITLVRLERGGADGNAASVTLTERFIEVMESEHRELGLGDPTLGKTVRKLVGMLARRTELWRATVVDEDVWDEAVRDSLYKDAADETAVKVSGGALRSFWKRLQDVAVADLTRGAIP